MDVYQVIAWSAGVFALGLVLKAVVRYFEEKKLQREFYKILKSLPAGFLYKNNAETLIVGPTGVWILKLCHQTNYSGKEGEKLLKEVLTRSTMIKKMISEKTALNINVQPVLVFPDSKANIKFEFQVNQGVDLVRRKWITKLVTEYPAENLENQTLEKLKILI